MTDINITKIMPVRFIHVDVIRLPSSGPLKPNEFNPYTAKFWSKYWYA